jgi:hypothetical protein
MNRNEYIRWQLRQLQAIRFAHRIGRELARTPGDPVLGWALRELLDELGVRVPSTGGRAPAGRSPH